MPGSSEPTSPVSSMAEQLTLDQLMLVRSRHWGQQLNNMDKYDDLINRMKEELEELKSDERMYYATATVFSNAPLAMIQLGIGTRINILEKYLDLPISTFPLKKRQ